MDFNSSKLDRNEIENFAGLAFGMFQVDLKNFFEVKHILYQKLRLQPREIEDMTYYELEYTLENLKTWLEKEKEAQEKSEGEQSSSYSKESMMKESQSMMKKYQGQNKMPSSSGSMPKIPNMGSMKMPKF